MLLLVMGCDGSTPVEDNTGRLQVAFSGPQDFETLNVELYLKDSCLGVPIETLVLKPSDMVTLFENLQTGLDYCIEAEAQNSGGTIFYGGQGAVFVRPDVTNLLTVLLDQQLISYEGNAPPRINAVTLDDGRVLRARDLDPDSTSNMYVIAPNIDEPVTFAVQIIDLDADPVTVTWAVKDGPSETAEKVGELTHVETQVF
jgi:hypothetical protein